MPSPGIGDSLKLPPAANEKKWGKVDENLARKLSNVLAYEVTLDDTMSKISDTIYSHREDYMVPKSRRKATHTQ